MEDENEFELELGLSIGRTQKRTKQNEVVSIANDHKIGFMNSHQEEEEEELVDPRAKREMQALRRKELKRKREEKRLVKKRGLFYGNGGEGLCNYVACNGAFKNVKFDKLMNVVPSGRVSGVLCGSSVSPASTSSSGSDRWRSPNSIDGGNSSENKSPLTQSLSDPPHADGSKAHNLRSESEHSAISQQVVIPAANNQTIPVEANASNASPSTLYTAKADDKADCEGADLTQKHITDTENSIPCPMRQCNVDNGKPPKPNCIPSTLPLLPFVSTKGNGPNGKTVNGFLYRYTKTEVSIVCVCHGTSFSPAEFVQHAGGTDVMHPLRHITVVPSAF